MTDTVLTAMVDDMAAPLIPPPSAAQPVAERPEVDDCPASLKLVVILILSGTIGLGLVGMLLSAVKISANCSDIPSSSQNPSDDDKCERQILVDTTLTTGLPISSGLALLCLCGCFPAMARRCGAIASAAVGACQSMGQSLVEVVRCCCADEELDIPRADQGLANLV